MAELPPGYNDVPEEDRKKAQSFFVHANSLAGSGQFDYSVSMFLDGLKLDPDAVDAHQKLRETSLKRKASGGKGLGMLEALKLKKATKDDKENLLNAEKLLAFDPGNTDHMLAMAQNAARAGYYDTVLWIGQVMMEAERDSAKPSASRFLALRDVYKKLEQFQLAADAAEYALRMKPGDMELQTEIKSLRAQQTIRGAGYDKRGSFRDQVRDMNAQLRLMDSDKHTVDADTTSRLIKAAEDELAADPNEPGKVSKLVDELVRSEKPENDERAIKLLTEWYEKTRQFRFRKRAGEIQMRQWHRKERLSYKSVQQTVDVDERKEKQKEWVELRRKQFEFELSEYALWSENYPTDMAIKYEMGRRQFALNRFDDAISSLQAARNDPGHRVEAAIMLGRAFLEAGFLEEADETLDTTIRDYPLREGEKFKQMLYWQGRALEARTKMEEAKKRYSQVFQMDSSYLDVAGRLKRLRNPGNDGNAAAAQ
ncbi:MAG TPA: tetratricopeptide repeat protein [Tepidisphaeraceae bacterium]|nr:tetratricopeptide repeat protein [Tepidisphaeraceae bacterium]